MSKRGIQYVQQDDPAFLKKFKQRIGYKEGPNIETKKAELPVDDSGSDKEDEQPQIVVLKKGDLSQEEVDRLKNKTEPSCDTGTSDKDEVSSDGKILFRKPIQKEDDTEVNAISSKKVKRKSKTGKGLKQHSNDKINNKTLLSFNDEEDDEND